MRYLRWIRHNDAGQAMIEFVVISVAMLALLAAIGLISDAYVIKQKTIVAARYGAWKMARNSDLDVSDVQDDINNFFFADLGDVTLSGGEKDTSGLVDGTLDFLNTIFSDDPLSVEYQVKYEHDLDIPSYFTKMGFPDSLTIGAVHEVDGNSWDFAHSDVHEGWNLLKSGVSGFFDALDI